MVEPAIPFKTSAKALAAYSIQTRRLPLPSVLYLSISGKGDP